MNEFREGDIVKLKSGGPDMTIEEIGKFGMAAVKVEAKCIWFEGNELKSHFFSFESLEKVGK